MKLGNVKIGTRMYLGFGLLMAVMACMIWVGISQTWEIQEKLQRIVQVNNQRGELAGAMAVHTRETSIQIRNILLEKPTDKKEEQKKRIEETKGKYDAAFTKLMDLTNKEDGKAHGFIAKVKECQDAGRALNQQVMSLAFAGKDGQALDLLNREARPAVRKWLDAVDALQLHQKERTQLRVEEAEKAYSSVVTLLFILGGFALVLSGLIAFFVTRSLSVPIRAGVGIIDGISKGDLTQEIPEALKSRRDEIGELAGAMSRVTGALRVLLMQVVNGTGTISATSDGLADISQRLTAGAKETSEKAHGVATAAEEASANTNSVAASMEQASTNLTSVAGATEEMSATVAEIASNSEKGRVISEEATVQAQAISTTMQQLGQAAKEIGKVTETITEISSQTNLLALNATIEAARAGAAGKGFAVVAGEIKELARQTAAATEDIKAKIAGVQTSTGGAIADIEKITGVIKEVGSVVSTIAVAIEEQATVTKDVAGNIAQASTGVKDANERVAQTAAVSQSIAKDIAQVSAEGRAMSRDSSHLEDNAAVLRRLTQQLDGIVSRFQITKDMQDFGRIKKGHLQWRSKLVDMFEGRQKITSADVTDHHQCPFGKWYYGEGGQKMKHLPLYDKVGGHHQAFHGLVAEIVQLWNGSREEDAFDRFRKLMPYTDELFAMLDQLSVESLGAGAESGGTC